jgi:peptide/nickel transport system ATP-binding protein
MTAQPLLTARDLSVSFATESGPVDAVRGISLEVGPGEILALVGESGSGKSATALALMGLLGGNARVSGSARFGGTELIGASGDQLRRIRGAEIATIFQDPLSALNPVMRIGDQIAEQIRAHGPATRAAADARAVELLGRVGIPSPRERSRSYPHELSGGMRQRAMIAMALSCDPRLLIADEPTTALDVTVQAQILELIRELRDATAMAVLFVTHDLGVVAQLADRVAVMRHGQIVEQAPVAELFRSPRQPYTRELLAAVPRLDGPRTVGPEVGEQPLLEVEHLEVQYGSPGPFRRGAAGVKAVDDVTLRLNRGEALGLVGESGCGKTTLARTAVRLIEPNGGSVRFDGQDVTTATRKQLAPLRGELQIVFQDPKGALNPRKRVREIIGLPLELAKTPAGAVSARVTELLDTVGLEPGIADRWPHQLSGGQAQRVGIARALARDPRLIVLDEPVSALDVSIQAQIVDLLGELRRELGVAYLFVAHDLSVVREVSDRIAVMYLGKLVELGPAEEICSRAVHPYTAELLAAVPVPDPAAPRRGGGGRVDEPPHDSPGGCVFHPRCPRATEVCRTVEPPLTRYPGDRMAACHHPLNVMPDDLADAVRSSDSPLSAGADAPTLV